MKRKVGELFNKPIVQGNENVLSSNEILVEQKGNTFSLKERVNGEIKEVSGEGGGSASTVEYLDITNVPSEGWLLITCMCSLFVKQEVPLGEIRANSVLPTFQSQSMRGDLMGVTQLAIDFKALISIGGIGQMTIAEFVMANGATQADIDAIPRITEEEFYNLDNGGGGIA